MNRIITCLIALLGFSSLSQAQKISSNFFGQNAWMPYWYFGGKLDDVWQKAKPGNFEIIRIGGIEYEDNFDPHIDDFVRFIDSIRITCKAEPIMQVPRNYTVQQTKDLYNYINVVKNKNVKYWSIGNEPDSHKPNTPAEIAAYFIKLARVLKDLNNTLILIGPDYANYWVHPGDQYDAGKTVYSNFINTVGMEMNTNNTAYLLDIFAFHNYVGYTLNDIDDNQNLELVVDNVNSTLLNINNQRLIGMANKASWGIGEFNIADLGNERTKRWGFYAGQYFAMVYGLGMEKGAAFICPWSLIEGEWRKGSDLSMFENQANNFTPRSTFYHTQMLAQNRRANFMNTTSSINDVKLVGMKDNTGSTLMLMNTSEVSAYNCSIKLDLGNATSNQLVVKMDAGFNLEYSEFIPSNTTITFIFNNQGQLIKKYTYKKSDSDSFKPPLLSINVTTSISSSQEIDGGSFYPNPNKNGVVQISTSSDWKVYSVLGHELKSGTGSTINLADYPKGMYLIRTNDRTERVMLE